MLTNPDCYRLAFSAIEDGVWECDLSSGTIRWDARCYEMLGYAADAFPITPESWRLLLHPADFRQVESARQAQLQAGGAFQCQFRLRTADDAWRWIESRGRIVAQDGGQATRMVGVHTDISARKAAELELQQSQRKIGALVASMQDLVLVIDTSGNISQYFHPGHGIPFERNAALMLGSNFPEVLPAEIATPLLDALGQVIVTGGATTFVCELSSGSGEFWADVTVSPLRAGKHWEGDSLVVVRDITAAKQHERDLEMLAMTDSLTGLPNRRSFMDRLDEEFARFQRFSTPTALLMLDLDHFKQVNDRWGHAAGDKVLMAFARTCKAAVRRMDVVGRIGGEEFAIILPGATCEVATKLAERIRAAVCNLTIQQTDGYLQRITVSIGVTVLFASADNINGLLELADQALYRAKHKGRNRVEVAAIA